MAEKQGCKSTSAPCLRHCRIAMAQAGSEGLSAQEWTIMHGPTYYGITMTDLTPSLPTRYRRRALASLEILVARAKDAVTTKRAAVSSLTVAGKETTDARASLGLAERGLALLRGRRRFLRSGEPPLNEG